MRSRLQNKGILEGSSKWKVSGAEVYVRELRESILMAIVTCSAQKEMQMIETSFQVNI